jgi:hypothetical protein
MIRAAAHPTTGIQLFYTYNDYATASSRLSAMGMRSWRWWVETGETFEDKPVYTVEIAPLDEAQRQVLDRAREHRGPLPATDELTEEAFHAAFPEATAMFPDDHDRLARFFAEILRFAPPVAPRAAPAPTRAAAPAPTPAAPPPAPTPTPAAPPPAPAPTPTPAAPPAPSPPAPSPPARKTAARKTAVSAASKPAVSAASKPAASVASKPAAVVVKPVARVSAPAVAQPRTPDLDRARAELLTVLARHQRRAEARLLTVLRAHAGHTLLLDPVTRRFLPAVYPYLRPLVAPAES